MDNLVVFTVGCLRANSNGQTDEQGYQNLRENAQEMKNNF